MFLFERIAFVCIPIVFYDLSGVQLMFLIMLKQFILAYYFKYRPLDINMTDFVLKMLAEYFTYLIIIVYIVLSDF